MRNPWAVPGVFGRRGGTDGRNADQMYCDRIWNDASVAMAEYISGTEEAFVDAMNKRAEELGMVNTHFTDCCGLTEDRII